MYLPFPAALTAALPIPDGVSDALEDIDPLIPSLAGQTQNPVIKALIWAVSLLGMVAVGIVIIKVILWIVKKLLRRTKVDNTAIPFLNSMVKALCYVFLFVIVMGTTGLVDTASLAAILGVLGLAVSLAVQDSLANLAGGALLLLNKPFTRGDFVDVGDISGTIVEISLTYTILRTVDNKRISIPNGQVTNARIINYSSEPYRRMEVLLTIERDSDMDLAEEVLLRALQSHPMTLKSPPCSAKVCDHSDLGAVVSCRAWATKEDYWTIYYDLPKLLKKALDENGISMPVRGRAVPPPPPREG